VVFSTNKTGHHDITEILLKVPFNTIKQTNKTNPKVVPMGAIVIRTRFDEGTESAEVATSVLAAIQLKR
jgi:hypothetical protein